MLGLLSDVVLSVFIIAFGMADWVLFRIQFWAVRPTHRRTVGCFAVFGIRSVDIRALSRLFGIHSLCISRHPLPTHNVLFLLADILLQTHPRPPKQRFHPFSKYNSPIVPLDLSGEQN
jgi:hypothetical protein